MAKVVFWLAPALAQWGNVAYEGFRLVIMGELIGTDSEKLKQVYMANPRNIASYLSSDLSSKKDGPLVYNLFNSETSFLQKHLMALYLLYEKPNGWNEQLFEHMNRLHLNSYYLSDLKEAILWDIEHAYLTKPEISHCKGLLAIVSAKHANAPKITEAKKDRPLPIKDIISASNKLHIDVIKAEEKKT